MPSNDNDPDGRPRMLRPADPYGQAALVLVESLIHGLIAQSILTPQASLDIVIAAVEVQTDYIVDADDAVTEMERSQALLSGIAASLSSDVAPPADGQGILRPTKPTLVDVNDRTEVPNDAIGWHGSEGRDRDMTRFFFDLHECGHGALIDDEGRELPDVATAREHAIGAARSIMADEVGKGHLCLGCSIVIRDDRGVPVMAVPFVEAVSVTFAASC